MTPTMMPTLMALWKARRTSANRIRVTTNQRRREEGGASVCSGGDRRMALACWNSCSVGLCIVIVEARMGEGDPGPQGEFVRGDCTGSERRRGENVIRFAAAVPPRSRTEAVRAHGCATERGGQTFLSALEGGQTG